MKKRIQWIVYILTARGTSACLLLDYTLALIEPTAGCRPLNEPFPQGVWRTGRCAEL